tara:strand:- start:500 stop:661 length:162 start_codon:yes stop_codon:yes gene_type:complete
LPLAIIIATLLLFVNFITSKKLTFYNDINLPNLETSPRPWLLQLVQAEEELSN